jgi:hypothetical protein
VFAAVAACATVAYAARGVWLDWIGRSLVCTQGALSAEAILLDNFANDYVLFRRAAQIERAGLTRRVLVPVTSPDGEDEAVAANEVANAFARVAGLSSWEPIVVNGGKEPISLNAAYRVRDFLLREHIGSVTLISPTFRSRRSALIYQTVLDGSGITFACRPVFGNAGLDTWTGTWHGIENVALQFLKLQYYRYWVLLRTT